MELSRAFDSLPHDLLLGKLRAYGLSDKACALIGIHLADRWQQVRLGAHCSEWSEIIKGVQQGSIIGLFCSTSVLLIYLIPNKYSLHNYADDNTLSYSHKDPDIFIHNWQHDSTAINITGITGTMSVSPLNVLILGDSHVFWLDYFVRSAGLAELFGELEIMVACPV